MWGEGRGDDERVEAPDDTFLADLFRELAEGLHPLVHARHVRFEAFLVIVVEGELEVVVDAPLVQFVQQGEQRTRVFRPEDHHLTVLEGDVHRLLVERVVPHAVARPQPVDEPLRIERRHVRRSAGGDDDGCGGFDELAGGGLYGGFVGHGDGDFGLFFGIFISVDEPTVYSIYSLLPKFRQQSKKNFNLLSKMGSSII